MDSRQKTIRRIKKILMSHPGGLTISDLAEKIRLNRNSTAKYLEILLISGDARMSMVGPAKVYTYTQRMSISAMLKFSTDFIILIDNEMQVLDANENAQKILGMSRDELIGIPIEQVRSPVIEAISIPRIFEEIQIKGEQRLEFGITRNNELRNFRVRIIPTIFEIGDEGLTIIGEDITEQIRSAESLTISEARYRAIVQDQTDAICRWRSGGEITFVNEAFCRVTGIPSDIPQGASIFSYLRKDDVPSAKDAVARLTKTQPTVSAEFRLADMQGVYRWYQWNMRGIFDERGKMVECQSVGRDIDTERRQAEKISESEERFRTITDISPFPISILDSSGTFLYINDIFEGFFGYSLDDIPTETEWFELAFPYMETREEAISAWKSQNAPAHAGGRRPSVFRITCKDGTARQVNCFRAILGSGEQFAVYEDLTSKKESERLHSVLATIVNSSNDAISLYRNINDNVPRQSE